MTPTLAKGHQRGTHRLVPPQTTLERIQPYLTRFGITRCADITGLDCIGIPVYIGVRPQGRALQTSNGKGLTHVDARVSALMEAIEHWHAENPAAVVRRTSYLELRRDHSRALRPRGIDGCPMTTASDRQQLDWLQGRELVSDEAAWIPAYATYYHRSQPYRFSYNGLASGNHPIEATLHALYEILERDALARLTGRQRVHLERCQMLALDDVLPDVIGMLADQIARAGLRLILLRTPSATPTHTMIAVILDPAPFSGASMINYGTGAHLSPVVAAIRAITEAAQTRLTFIHGSREDLNHRAYQRNANHEAMFAYFTALQVNATWSNLEDHASDDLRRDLAVLIQVIQAIGHTAVYVADISHGLAGVSTVKVIVPGTRCPTWI